MKNEYVLSFLSSPLNPASDNWVGQNFILSYLNSQPGSNYLFAYKPFELLHSRSGKENRFADAVVGEGVNQSHADHFFIKKENYGVDAQRFEGRNKAILKHFEAMGQHGFEAVLQETTSLVEFVKIASSLILKDINVEILSSAVVPKMWNRETIEQIAYRIAERPAFFQDTIRVLQFLADNHGLDRESVQIAQAIIGHIEKLKRGLPVYIRLPDRDEENRRKDSRVRGLQVVFDLAMLESSIEYSFAKTDKWTKDFFQKLDQAGAVRQSKESEDLAGYIIGHELEVTNAIQFHGYRYAPGEDVEAFRSHLSKVASDGDTDVYANIGYRVFDLPDRIGHENPGLLNARTPDQLGHAGGLYEIAYSYDRIGYLTPIKLIFDDYLNNRATTAKDLQFGSRFNKTVLLVNHMQLAGDFGKLSRIIEGSVKFEEGRGSDSRRIHRVLHSFYDGKESAGMFHILRANTPEKTSMVCYQLHTADTFGKETLNPTLETKRAKSDQDIGRIVHQWQAGHTPEKISRSSDQDLLRADESHVSAISVTAHLLGTETNLIGRFSKPIWLSDTFNTQADRKSVV